MNASHVEERTHFVLVKLTAEEAELLALDAQLAGADALCFAKDNSLPSAAAFAKARANRLEVFASALGVALAQLPKEGG